MDSAKFKEIFSKKSYQLPIRWNGEDFYATLYEHLYNYREKDIGKNSALYTEVKAICRGICDAVDYSLRGYPEKAYKSFESVMDILGKAPLLIDKEDINKENLYRVVDVESAAVPKRQRIFHVPFTMRSKMSTQRYSIPGFPSLYLGTSLELCLMEIGKNPQRDYVCVSRYELQTDKRVDSSGRAESNQSPVFDNDKFIIFDISIKPEEAIKKLCNSEDFVRYIKWYPLISACSYIRAVRGDRIVYSPEYIVPQLFLQWVRSEDEDAVVGIKYFSCAPVYESSLGNNYVFPTMGVPNQVRNTIKNYCAKLSHRFKLTAPRFLMEYESIDDCKDAVIKDKELEYIEDYSTNEDEKIEGEYKVSDGVSAIGAFAFSDCGSMTGINLPDSVTSIGNYAFYRCISLTNINIPDSVTSIGDSAFSGCISLKSINIPDSVTNIGNAAFLSCTSLTNINIPDSITSIGYATFIGCSSLKSINIPDSVTSIGDGAFSVCSSLQSINIPDSVTSIGDSAFSDCISLTSINIPDSVTSIGTGAFESCERLTKITVNRSNKHYKSAGGILYNKSKTNLLCFPAGKKQKSFAIPPDVTSIGASAFYNCSSLTSISISNNVTNIGNFAFFDCISLISINIPDNVTSIGASTFSRCNSLKIINIPDNVMSIGDSAFSECSSLTSINIPDNVMSIGDNAFSDCSSLNSINLPDSVTSIGDSAFSGCISLKSINIPDDVTSIGAGAFSNCKKLTKITVNSSNEHYKSVGGILYNKSKTSLLCFPAGKKQKSFAIPPDVTSIDDSAFSNCSSLTSISISNNVTNIGNYAFYRCISLTSINIPDSVTVIGENAFSDCSSLTNISISKNITNLGEGVFNSCKKLTNIEIPDGVTSIGNLAFYRCSSLKSINIPDSVTSIGFSAFYKCSLDAVYYSGTKEQAKMITIDKDNDVLLTAKWEYGSLDSES
jgi:hypothetical protein